MPPYTQPRPPLRSFARRRATVVARGSPQQPPAAARPAARSSLRAQGSAAGPPQDRLPGAAASASAPDPAAPTLLKYSLCIAVDEILVSELQFSPRPLPSLPMADSDGEATPSRHLANTSVQLLPSPTTTDGIDITRFIKFKLDAEVGNYNKWSNFFLFVLSKFNARDHVEEETDPHLADAEWRSADIDIVLWIYATISDDLHDIILKADSTAYTAWRALKHFFTAHAEGREIHLDKEFHNIKQGDMTVLAYCRKLKSVADQLGDVGAPVTDKKLTMRLIDGLAKRFRTQGELLSGGSVFPTFMQVQSRLQLAEQKLKSEEEETPQVLHTHANGNNIGTNGGAPPYRFNDNCYTCGELGHMARNCPRGTHHNGQPGRGSGQQNYGRGGGGPQQYGYGNNQEYGGGRGRGRGRGRGDQGGRGGYNPGYGYHQPNQGYGGAPPAPHHRQVSWVPPNAAGVLGPRPGAHFQAYPMVQAPAPPPALYTPPAAHTYDYSAMFNAAPSNTASFHPGGDWVMDSGATAHVTNNTGANVVTGKWIFRHKLNSDGSLSRYKARWVVRGFTQQAVDPSQPRSSRRRGPEDAAAEPSACPRASTRDELPAAAHSRTSFARWSAPTVAKGKGGGGGVAEPGG
ncbi:hypothetical protein QYE76_057879 [Lolium multiflorum]|uniref:CCHC-type domain-containing protein n=1 Tax=Lolium multiflorum TaxID=4521 RepID=A0AAD8T5Z1_LOLMU|nr:hypothetical protein QYE76_057879 [Lolium multiflorum]